MIATKLSRLRVSARKAVTVLQGLLLASSALFPILAANSVSAASVQLTNRAAYVSTGTVGATTNFAIQFRIPSGTFIIKQIEIEFCTTPLGTCSATLGTNVPTLPASSTVTLFNQDSTPHNYWTDTTAFTYAKATGRLNASVQNQITLTRSGASTQETQSGSNDRGLTFTGLTNPSTVNTTYYPRVRMYSDLGTTQVYDGAMAQATNQTLTVNARVQEVLQFCIGTTTIDSAVTQITNQNNSVNVTSCSAADGTSVDLGTVDSSHINVTPVPTGNQGDARLAYAMVQTNAQNGVVIGYQAVLDASGSGKLKVAGGSVTCSGTTTTDQCFNSAGTSQTTFTAGQEKFGMTVAGVNCANVSTNYTCTYSSGQSNLQPKTNYFQPSSYSAGVSGTYQGAGQQPTGYLTSSTENFAWDDTGTYHAIAGSDTASLKVVANEALMIKFAATSKITTPTGIYQAQADFIATPTY